MVKKNYKMIVGIIIGIIVSSIGVYAASLSSSEVTYDNKTSGMKSKNLQDALDELYDKTNSCKKYIPNDNPNKNIVKAYKYNEDSSLPTYCVSGEEDTCFMTSCYENNAKGECPVGTIIYYKVNSNKTEVFHVLHDDGETMTLQSQKNTINNVAWNETTIDSSKGPITALAELDNATKDWSNVNEIEYTPGITTLYENAFTGCKYDGGDQGSYEPYCLENIYTLDKIKSRARMITAQEAGSVGCLVYKNDNDRILRPGLDKYNNYSCLDFMYNSLDGTPSIYWTMSSNSTNFYTAWRILNGGNMAGCSPTTPNSVRAVVEINKSSG